MSIRDRDYMKRPSEDRGDDLESKAEEVAQNFLRKYPKIFWFCGMGLAVLVVIALILMFSAT